MPFREWSCSQGDKQKLSRSCQSRKPSGICRQKAVSECTVVPVPREGCRGSNFISLGNKRAPLAGVTRQASEKRKNWGRPRWMRKNIRRVNYGLRPSKGQIYIWCLDPFEWEECESLPHICLLCLSSSPWVVKGIKMLKRYGGTEESKIPGPGSEVIRSSP